MCDRDTGIDCLPVLLDAGASARGCRDRSGRPLTLVLLLSHYRVPAYREAIELLLRHGAEADQPDPVSGRTTLHHAGEHPGIVRLLVEAGADAERLDEYGRSPVVLFTSERHWESARFLVERGVRLDVATPNGVSLDCYLQDWKESVFGEHPEGWDRLRSAILSRRAAPEPRG